MQRTLRTFHYLALGALLSALTACSHKTSNAPLAFVPADTVFVVANLKPLNADAQAAMLEAANQQISTLLARLNTGAGILDADNDPHLASLLRAIAGEYDGVGSVQQLAAKEGVDIRGLSALYTVGLNPVLRLPLSDPAKFSALIGRLEKSYGQPLAQATVGKLKYRHLSFDGAKLQALFVVENQQAVMALAPAGADQALLRRILGVDRPKQSAQDAERLKTLANANTYTPYALGYVDTTRLPALLTDASDPMLKALWSDTKGHILPTTCRADLDRIAARVPMLGFGYTALTAKHAVQRYDIHLAPDIVAAFANVQPAVPGLGSSTPSPFDMALALPIKALHDFWNTQVKAVAAKPFKCPLLTPLNDGFAKLGNALPNTSIPSINDLRGLRISIDTVTRAATGSVPAIRGRLLIASAHPASLFAMAKSFVSALDPIKLTNDAKPVALPSDLTAMATQPGWVAMNDQALAIGIGTGEDAKLGAMLSAPPGAPGERFSAHVDGRMYGKYIAYMAERTTQIMDRAGNAAKTPKQRETLKKMKADTAASLASTRAAIDKIKQMDFAARMGDHGLIFTSTLDLR